MNDPFFHFAGLFPTDDGSENGSRIDPTPKSKPKRSELLRGSSVKFSDLTETGNPAGGRAETCPKIGTASAMCWRRIVRRPGMVVGM